MIPAARSVPVAATRQGSIPGVLRGSPLTRPIGSGLEEGASLRRASLLWLAEVVTVSIGGFNLGIVERLEARKPVQ